MTKKYDLHFIMTKAWELYRKAHLKIDRFGEALHRAWEVFRQKEDNARQVADAIAEHGITEEVHTHFAWGQYGREVAHGSKCLFQVVLRNAERGDGKTFLTSFFGLSQTVLAGTQD